MRKISVKNLLLFRSKSPKGKRNFANNLKLPLKPKPSGTNGGNYWVRSLSAICNSFKENDPDFIKNKITEIQREIVPGIAFRTKTMYERNLVILNSFLGFDLSKIRPGKEIEILKKNPSNAVLTIKGLEIEADSRQVYVFQDKKAGKVGAVWFIAKLGGLKRDELGIYVDVLFRYLKKNFSKGKELDLKYCLAVDVFTPQYINYSAIKTGKLPSLLDETLDEIKKLM